MGKFNLGQFAIGAGTGYLRGEQQNRDRERQDRRDQQSDQLFESRMRQDRMREEDMVATRADKQTLRTAARPIVPVDDMTLPADMDNRDVGLAENASRPNGGLTLAGARVGGKTYATRAEADAAAAKQNTPEAMTKRYADAQRSTGDLSGAAATEANMQKTLRERQAKAADDMMNEIGKGFMTGGWTGGTEVLSRSGADGNDYRSEIDPATGKVRMHQIQRATGKTRVLGEFSNDNSGMLDAYKQIGAAIAGKPDIAMAHIADREKRADALRKEENKGKLDAEKMELAGKKLELQSELGAARIDAATARRNGAAEGRDKPPSGYRKLPNGDLEAIPGGPATKGNDGVSRFTPAVTAAGTALVAAQDAAAKRVPKLSDIDAMNPAKVAAYEQRVADAVAKNPDVIEQTERLKTLRAREYKDLTGEDKPKPGLADAKPVAKAAPVAMPKAKAELKAGQVYQTARGPAKWNGSAFEAQ